MWAAYGTTPLPTSERSYSSDVDTSDASADGRPLTPLLLRATQSEDHNPESSCRFVRVRKTNENTGNRDAERDHAAGSKSGETEVELGRRRRAPVQREQQASGATVKARRENNGAGAGQLAGNGRSTAVGQVKGATGRPEMSMGRWLSGAWETVRGTMRRAEWPNHSHNGANEKLYK